MPTRPIRFDRQPGFSARRAIRNGLAGGTVLALAACGGGGGGGGGSTTTPPGGGAASFYLAGPAGIDRANGGNIGFALGASASGTALSLDAVTPATGADATMVGGGSWLNMGQVGQWTAATGSATAIGERYDVYAATDGRFHVADLQMVAGASGPTTALLSSLTTSAVCSSPPAVINDLANPAKSLLVFDGPGVSQSCGAADDVFSVVPLSATSGTTPIATGNVEPVDAARDASGAITSLLLLVHGATPSVAVATGTSTTAGRVVISNLAAPGINNGSLGDFQSLAVISMGSTSVWLYRDTNQIFGVKLSDPTHPVMVFQGQDADTVQGRALVNGTVAYVAMIDTSNCSNPPFNTSCTNQIVRIDVSSLAPAEGVIMAQEMTTGLQLLGISGGNLFYEFTDGSQLNVITTSASGTNPGSPVFAASGGSTLDLSTLQMPAPLPLPVVVAGGVYYTVYTPSAPGVPYLRAWFSNGTSHTAIGSFSMVLGGVLASPIPTSFASLVANPTSSTNAVVPIYGSALIATMPPGNAAKETPPLPGDVFPGTTIASYDGNGALSATLGQLYASLVSDEYDGVTISPGAMQEGMPALLYVSGYSTQTSYIGHDLYKITPGTANSLIQVTNNLQ